MTQAQSVDTIAFVPQATSQALVCETPLKELAFGLENRGVSEKEMRRRIFETVSFFGMEALLHKRCNELSILAEHAKALQVRYADAFCYATKTTLDQKGA